MAQQQQQKKRAQGAGRPANSEPKVQLFKEFNGINFENAHSFAVVDEAITSNDQTDLQMNQFRLQNNVAVASNMTLVTRDDIVELFKAPTGVTFTGPTCLYGPKLYIAKSDENIGVADLDDRAAASSATVINTNLTLSDQTELSPHHVWTSIDQYDAKLIALTAQNEIWTGDTVGYVSGALSNARKVPDPIALPFSALTGVGLTLSQTETQACPFRVTLAYTFVNKFGPTKISPNLVFYASKPPTEWHASRYVKITGSTSDNTFKAGYLIKAVELYYATDSAMDLIFLGRVDVASNATGWEYKWLGYIDATSMWAIGNLVAPTENYTQGVHASRVTDIDGRLYFWGDSSNKHRLYIGGNPGNLLSVSPGHGGGFVDVEPGTGQAVRYVCKYKTQSGNSIVTMLCASPNTKKDQRYNLVENSIALSNEQSMRSWQAEQVAGAVGCKSFDGAIVCADGLYSISRYGLALTTMTMEYNSQIRTQYVSDAIKPVFTDSVDKEERLLGSMILELDGVIYMALGSNSDEEGNLDNVLFCYDIDMKAWWTYTLDVDAPILSLFHVDWQGQREGIGIVTANKVYMLPTTVGDDPDGIPNHSFLIESAQISTQQPQQGWHWLSQLEFHFDRFVGSATFELRAYDMFGREIKVTKDVYTDDMLHDYVVHMRVDQRLMSYVLTISGNANFRMTHFMARVYTYSNKVGQVWGFDDSISHRSSGDVQYTFKSYNDIRKAIFT